ncbi:MAG: phosphoglycerate kinase [Actinomycetota bacterium]|nr:phosphoglycerate kinase [Actinomycetota bacterium]
MVSCVRARSSKAGKQIPDPEHPESASELFQIEDLELRGRRVLTRCDFNVPLDRGRIADDFRISSTVPTLQRLLDSGASITACSHLGRPKGRVVDELRLDPIAERLREMLGRDVLKANDVVGPSAREAVASGAAVVLLENLRFEPGEESNDPRFAGELASLGDAYVDDAFGAAHRSHASVVGVAERIPCAAGLLLAEEVRKLERLLVAPDHPFVAVLGGAKVSDKLAMIENFLDRVDAICIGGAMAFTLLAASGRPIGRSRVEEDRLDSVAKMLGRARNKGVEMALPVDVVAASDASPGAPHDTVALDEIGDRMGVDIGPRTCERFASVIEGARSVLWNGPMGIFEIEDYAAGTRAIAAAVVEATARGAYTVVGGGDSAAALKQLGLTDGVSHLSTGGGASLEFLEGRELPGIAVLRRKRQGL